MATASLFKEVFAKTGPLSQYLQSVNMDYAKALALIDSAIASLEGMRSAPQDISVQVRTIFSRLRERIAHPCDI